MDIVTYVLAKNSANSAIATAIAALPKGLIYRGAVSYVSDLPNNAEIGDCYTIKYKGTSGTTADGHEVAWGNYEGTPQWVDFGGGGGGSSITVDDALSDSSENPVQNKVIAKEVGDLKSAISQKEDALSIVQKTSSDVTITLEEDKFYIFPTMTELTVTCPLTGLYGFRFTSGTTPTVFLMSGITMPDNWNGTEASKTYDMTILNGLALVTSWSV